MPSFGEKKGKEFTAPAGQVLPTQTYQARGCACTQARLKGSLQELGEGRAKIQCPDFTSVPACATTTMGSMRMPRKAASSQHGFVLYVALCSSHTTSYNSKPAAGTRVGGYFLIHSCPFSSSWWWRSDHIKGWAGSASYCLRSLSPWAVSKGCSRHSLLGAGCCRVKSLQQE